MFQDDFASVAAEAPAYAPDGGVFFFNPWFWITALLIGAMVGIFSWAAGQNRMRSQVEANRKAACEGIWKAINDRARTAAAASRTDVPSTAAALVKEIRTLLGPIAELAPLGAKAVKIAEAVEGKPAKPDAPKPAPPAPPPPASHAGGSEPPTAGGDAGHVGAVPAAHAQPGSHIHINIGDHHHAGVHHGPAQGAHPAHPPKKDEDKKPDGPKNGVDIDAIRAAVLAFCDYWSDKDRIVGQLREAQIRLLTPPPEKHPHGPFRHGG